MDTNKDGVLTIDEIKAGYGNILGKSNIFADKDAEEIMEKIDFNKNGVIDYGEFLTAASNFNEMITLNFLQNAFEAFDFVNYKHLN
jgi:Ca2+-binding EF-hand superfamily protein